VSYPFNKVNKPKLPKYRQQGTCPSRDSNIQLLHHKKNGCTHTSPCTTCSFGALWSLAGSSYTELQAETKISKTCNEYYKRWTNEAEWDLQACF